MPVACNHILKNMCSCPPEPASVVALPDSGQNRKWAREIWHKRNDPEGLAILLAEREAARKEEPEPAPTVEQYEEVGLADRIVWACMDPTVRARYKRELDAHAARATFEEYIQQAWHVIEPSTGLSFNWHHRLMCRVLAGMFEDWEKGQDDTLFEQKVQRALFNVPPGSLKPCYVGGVIVEKTRGLIKLGDVIVGDSVLTHRGRFRKVLAVAEQGELPLIEFLTGRGRVIKVAGDHPMHTQRGWIRADQVTTSDVFAAVHATEPCGAAGMSPEEARLLGYLIGDGSINQRNASFTNQDPESIADFELCAQTIGFETTKRARPPSHSKSGWSTHVIALKSRKPLTCSCGKPLRPGRHLCQRCGDQRALGRLEYDKPSQAVPRWLSEHDLMYKNSRTKRVPAAVMQSNESVIAEYLAAYWSCDGAIHDRRDLPRSGRNNQSTNTVRVSATTISEGLVRDHQLLLQRLGMAFRVRRKVSKLTKAMVGKDGRRIGEDYVSWDITASDQDTAAKFMQVIGPLMRHEKRTRAAGLTRTAFDQVLNPDEVVSITSGGVGECRCLQVEEDSSFSYQGVAVHNSRIIAVMFPTWVWLRRPGCKFICLSVNEDATMRDARDSRTLIKSTWYQETFQPDWKLKDDQDALSNYGNTAGGTRLSRAQGSEIVGLRADILLVDDPNNPHEAESKRARDEVNELWETNIYNRVNDLRKSLWIGVQQRTNAGDWSGYILKNQGAWSKDNPGGWLHVVLPAEFELARKCTTPWGNDPRKVEGQSIHPERLPPKVLAEERKRFGSAKYAGQMQQRPALVEGGRVKRTWWNWCRLVSGVDTRADEEFQQGSLRPRPAHSNNTPPRVVGKATFKDAWDFDWLVITVDPAAKKTERGSNYGILVMAGQGERRFVLDDKSQRGDILEILAVLRQLIVKWRPDRILVEEKAAGPDIMTMLKEQLASGDVISNDGHAIITVIEGVEPGAADKEMRLDACLPVIEAGMLFLLDGAPWVEEFVEELSLFPNGTYDDRVDALSQCLNHIRASESTLPDW